MILYHVTDIENLGSIAESGLVPACGRLSRKLGEKEDRVYFFHDPLDVANACANWLGSEFDELDEEDGYEHFHVVLECRVEECEDLDTSFYEVSIGYVLPPEDIRISQNPDLVVDFDYTRDFIAGYPELAEWS